MSKARQQDGITVLDFEGLRKAGRRWGMCECFCAIPSLPCEEPTSFTEQRFLSKAVPAVFDQKNAPFGYAHYCKPHCSRRTPHGTSEIVGSIE